MALADRAIDSIEAAVVALARAPFIHRKAGHSPFLRELVIAFGHSGYVALFEIEDAATVTVLAVRQDFNNAFKGIIMLPLKARFGVYVAYKYYLSLFNKIKRLQAANILEERIRIPNYGKAVILAKAGLRSQFNLL